MLEIDGSVNNFIESSKSEEEWQRIDDDDDDGKRMWGDPNRKETGGKEVSK